MKVFHKAEEDDTGVVVQVSQNYIHNHWQFLRSYQIMKHWAANTGLWCFYVVSKGVCAYFCGS